MKTLRIARLHRHGAVAVALLAAFAGNVNAESLVAVNSRNQIGVFDSSSAIINTTLFNSITGTAAGETFVGIDLRPSNNLVYGISSANRIYTINPNTGVSVFVANLSQSIIDVANKSYGLDTNPIVDRTTGSSLRLVSSTGDNYGINAATGAVTVATSIAAGFTGVAYRNSDASTPAVAPASTELYYINSTTDTLASAQTNFNNPVITTDGPLGVNIINVNGFEITRTSNAFGAFITNPNSLNSDLFSVDLDAGTALKLGTFIGTVNGLTSAPVSPIPEPETYAMMLAGLGMLGFATRRRKNKQANSLAA